MTTFMFYLLLMAPLVTSLLSFASARDSSKGIAMANRVNIIGVSVFLVTALIVGFSACAQGEIFAVGRWFHLDSLGALFLVVLGLIGFITGLYSVGYMSQEVQHGEVSARSLWHYYGFFHLFLFTMLLAVTTNNLIVMWVAIEATTLSSAFLVGFYGQRSSLEAAWKYIVICTVGVAFGLYGTVLVYSNASNIMDPGSAVFWTEVVKHPGQMDKTLMHIAFVFVLIGFGTKAGLFPMHAWLPDAHSEAPSPTSALLSAGLLNCAMLIIIRYYVIISDTIGKTFPSVLLMVFGFLSVGIAAVLILVQQDIKRLLAYSSVENMGLIAIALGIGGPFGIFAALLHALNHSLAKALLFCGSGNILLKYGTRDMCTVKGLLQVAPVTAILFVGGALALGGMPPFNVFVSEFMAISAGIHAGNIALVVLLLVLLTIVLGGLIRMIAKTVMGAAPQEVEKGELGWMTTAPMAILIALMLVMGTCVPDSVKQMIGKATGVVLSHGEQTEVNLQAYMPWLAPNKENMQSKQESEPLQQDNNRVASLEGAQAVRVSFPVGGVK